MNFFRYALIFPFFALVFGFLYFHASPSSPWGSLAGNLTAGFIEFSIIFCVVDLSLRKREEAEHTAKQNAALLTLRKPILDLSGFVFGALRATASSPEKSGKIPLMELFSEKTASQITNLQMDVTSNFSLGQMKVTSEGKLEFPPLLSWQDYITYVTYTWLNAIDSFVSRYSVIVSAEILEVCELIKNHPFNRHIEVHNNFRNMLSEGVEINGDSCWVSELNTPDNEKLSSYFKLIRKLIKYLQEVDPDDDNVRWFDANWYLNREPKIGSGLK